MGLWDERAGWLQARNVERTSRRTGVAESFLLFCLHVCARWRSSPFRRPGRAGRNPQLQVQYANCRKMAANLPGESPDRHGDRKVDCASQRRPRPDLSEDIEDLAVSTPVSDIRILTETEVLKLRLGDRG
jgi:hypothetical protein